MRLSDFMHGLRVSLSSRRRKPRAAHPRRRLELDRLEDRTVPAQLTLASGVLTYTAGSGVANYLTVNYDAPTQRYTFSDTAETIILNGVLGSGSGTNSVTLDPVAHISVLVRLGDLGDTAQVLGTRLDKPMFVYGEAGDDWVDVGNGATTLSNIRGNVYVRGFGGHDEVHLHDYAQPLPGQLYQVTNQYVTRGGIARVHYDAQVELVRLNAGTNNDFVRVWSTSAATTMAVSLKAGGADTAVVGSAAGSLDSIKGYLLIAGEKGAGPVDTLIVNDYADQNANVYRLTANTDAVGGTFTQVTRNGTMLLNAGNMKSMALNAGAKADTVRVEGVLIPTTVNAGAGHDRVMMFPGAVFAPVQVNGQAGTDTLDYLLYSGNVYVNLNLLTGKATDLDNGVSGIENVFGGAGHDILVGNGNVNVLRGGGGDDLIIGRQGGDWLFGDAGDDLIVGGRTIYDANETALQNIGATWSSASSYLAGIALLKNPNYPYKLVAGVTVFADGAQDHLIGGAGADWFWKDFFDLLNKAALELIN